MASKQDHIERKKQISELIISEFENYKNSFNPKTETPRYQIGEHRFNSVAKSKTIDLRTEQPPTIKEPFISYVRVLEGEVKNGIEVSQKECVYLIRRGGSTDVQAHNPDARFIFESSRFLGDIATEDLGPLEEDRKLFSKTGRLERTLRITILEKNLFAFSLKDYDAVENELYISENAEFIPSLRKLLANTQKSAATPQERWRYISKTFGLKDRPNLDKSQIAICQLPLSSQLLLTGFPGTGKTTTLIKRLSFKSTWEHLSEFEGLDIEEETLERWTMFTPSELLKTYLKEAMNRQGLSASDEKVKVWDVERKVLGREVLRFLKVGDRGIFAPINKELLTFTNSAELLSYLDQFTNYFMELQRDKSSDGVTNNAVDYRKILSRIPSYYKRFRQDLVRKSIPSIINPKCKTEIKDDRISDAEMDVLIFSMLKVARKIFTDNEDLLYKNTGNELLENIKFRYATQVAVDEATDFSVTQLGCMYYLSHPRHSSVSFVGDLMQRITQVGLRDWKECLYISDKFKSRELVSPYRQTPALLEIASKLYESSIGNAPNLKLRSVEFGEVPRPLKFQSPDMQAFGDWFVERVLEIYQLNNSHLPTIAVFVPTDDDIEAVFKIIQPKLESNSIDVEKSLKGVTTGDDSRVRIFSVEYIKGLEFEAVFFVNIDKIQNDKLIDKYVYVGLTRAKTFLGITYEDEFPTSIKAVENDFDDGNWSKFI